MKAKCYQCGFSGDVSKFNDVMSIYHDICCPRCGTTRIDTSEINLTLKKEGREYGYGDDNFLRLK